MSLLFYRAVCSEAILFIWPSDRWPYCNLVTRTQTIASYFRISELSFDMCHRRVGGSPWRPMTQVWDQLIRGHMVDRGLDIKTHTKYSWCAHTRLVQSEHYSPKLTSKSPVQPQLPLSVTVRSCQPGAFIPVRQSVSESK